MNLVTAVADILAGAFLVAAPFEPLHWALVCLAGALMHAGALVLNDRKGQEPGFGLPPARAPLKGPADRDAAVRLGTGLLGAGVLLAFSLDRALLGPAALGLCIALAVQSVILGDNALGAAAAGGMARALGLVLGMGMAGWPDGGAGLVLWPVVHLAYGFAIVAVVRQPLLGGTRGRLLGWLAVVAAACHVLLRLVPPQRWEARVFVAGLVLAAARPLVMALRRASPERVAAAGRAMQRSPIALDAVYAAAGSGAKAGALISLPLLAAEAFEQFQRARRKT